MRAQSSWERPSCHMGLSPPVITAPLCSGGRTKPHGGWVSPPALLC